MPRVSAALYKFIARVSSELGTPVRQIQTADLTKYLMGV